MQLTPTQPSRAAKAKDGLSNPDIWICLAYIDENLNDKITLDDLADLTGCDKFQLIRAFRRMLGTTPHAYILEERVARAAEMLKLGEPAAEVASEVGFVDQSHMIRYFKRHIGATPKQFVFERTA